MMDNATISSVLTERRNAVQWIWLNRPEVKNAITSPMADELLRAIHSAVTEKARVIVLSGKGNAFCAGAELNSIRSDSGNPVNVQEQLEQHYHPLIIGMTTCPLPIIAALPGPAVGIGSDIALAADIRIASEKAFLAEVFINIGLIPDGGGTFHLPRLVGLGRSLELAMTGARVSAQQGLEWGLMNRVVASESFEEQVQEFADTLAQKAPLALTAAKQALRKALFDTDIAQSLYREAVMQQQLSETEDFREGVNAFLEKRSANFQGR